MSAVNATAQVIQVEMASKAFNYADLSQVVSDLHAVIDRVDELENELAQLVENLGEEARSKRESETSVAHGREPLHCKGPGAQLGRALDGALAMQGGFPGWMGHFADDDGGERANSHTEPGYSERTQHGRGTTGPQYF